MAKNSQQQLSNYLSTGALIVLASLLPPLSLPAISQTVKSRSQPVRISKTFSWGDVLNLLAPPRRRPGTSRDPKFCWVSMSELANVTNRVATGNPTIYWKDNASEIGIRILGETRPFWRKSIADIRNPGIRQLRYDGPALEPGVDYELAVYSAGGDGLKFGLKFANFQVISSEEQAKLRDQLKPLKGKDNATLLKRIAIYNEYQLTTDAVTELLSARSPSPEIRQAIEQIPEQWCPQPDKPTPSTPSP